MQFVRNGEIFNMNKIDWCEVGLLLADIATRNVGEHYLAQRMKYIMLGIDNWDIILVQEGWKNIG